MHDEWTKGIIEFGIGLILMLLIIGSVFPIWLLVGAPRDPGGIICDDASVMRSIALLVQGRREVGCSSHDSPIIDVEGLGK
jgi:hypothetical protein